MLALVYPLAVSNGKLTLTSDYETIVRQHVIHAIDTKLEELLMLPEYGCPYTPFMSVRDIPEFLGKVEDSVKLSLSSFKDVYVDAFAEFLQDGHLYLEIRYSLESVETASIERLIQLGYA